MSSSDSTTFSLFEYGLNGMSAGAHSSVSDPGSQEGSNGEHQRSAASGPTRCTKGERCKRRWACCCNVDDELQRTEG